MRRQYNNIMLASCAVVVNAKKSIGLFFPTPKRIVIITLIYQRFDER